MTGNQVLTPIYPVVARYINIASEHTTPGTLATTGYVTVPVAGFDPDPKLNMIIDNGERGSMTDTYDAIPAAWWTEATIPESSVYADTIGHILLNLMGSLSTTGTAGTPTWVAAGGVTAGAGPITVTSGSVAVQGSYIQIGTGLTSEVVTVGSGSTATSIVVSANTPIRMSHTGSTTVTTVTAPFTHFFSVLNPGSATGVNTGQCPTHSILDRNQIAGSGGFYADSYPYCCFTEVKLTGMATGRLTWSGTLTAWPQGNPAAAPTLTLGTARMLPAWKGTSTIGGTSTYDITEWQLTLQRKFETVPTIDGQQAPSAMARGALNGTFTLMYGAATDQTALNYYLQNVQPSLVWTTGNGLTGSNQQQFSLNANIGTATDAKLDASKTIFGYSLSGDLLGNSSSIGESGGYGPFTISLVNSVPTF